MFWSILPNRDFLRLLMIDQGGDHSSPSVTTSTTSSSRPYSNPTHHLKAAYGTWRLKRLLRASMLEIPHQNGGWTSLSALSRSTYGNWAICSMTSSEYVWGPEVYQGPLIYIFTDPWTYQRRLKAVIRQDGIRRPSETTDLLRCTRGSAQDQKQPPSGCALGTAPNGGICRRISDQRTNDTTPDYTAHAYFPGGCWWSGCEWVEIFELNRSLTNTVTCLD